MTVLSFLGKSFCIPAAEIILYESISVASKIYCYPLDVFLDHYLVCLKLNLNDIWVLDIFNLLRSAG